MYKLLLSRNLALNAPRPELSREINKLIISCNDSDSLQKSRRDHLTAPRLTKTIDE